MNNWTNEFSGAITICDRKGTIVYLNEKAASNFKKYGGYELIGQNLFDCHNAASCEKIKKMLMKPTINVYTTQNEEKRQLIYQTPWHEDGKFMGLVEVVLDLPFDIPNYLR